MSDTDKAAGAAKIDARITALKAAGKTDNEAAAIVQVLDADANARFEQRYTEHFQAGQFDGANIRGRELEVMKDRRDFMAMEANHMGQLAHTVGRLTGMFETVYSNAWTDSYKNHVLNGHMIVLVLFVVNVIGKFYAHQGLAGAGIVACFFAYVSAYFGEGRPVPKQRRSWYWLCFAFTLVAALIALQVLAVR